MNNVEQLHKEIPLVEWEKLLESSITNTIFQTARFQNIWLHIFSENTKPMVVSEFSGAGLCGFSLLQNRNGELTFVGGNDVSDYLDFIIRSDKNFEKTYKKIWEKMTRVPWSKISLNCIPEKSPTLSVIPKLALGSGYHVVTELKNHCPVIEVPATWKYYLEKLDRKKRHELLRKRRRLENSGVVRFRRTKNISELKKDFPEFIRLHKLSSNQKNEFMDERMESFFRELADEFILDGKLALEFTSIDNINIAASFSFEYKDNLYYYNSGFDPSYRELSPGINHAANVINNAISNKMRVVDFLQGDEKYKYDLGAVNTGVYNIVVEKDGKRT